MQTKTTKTLIAISLLCMSASSMAQWQWLDRSGRKVFSDQPPPADVPERNIIKRPGGAPSRITVVTEPEQAAETSASAPASAARAPQPAASGPTPAQQKKEQEEEARKAAKRKAEEEKVAKAKQENCQRAKNSLAGLKTGMRVRTVNEKGEATIMDDKARAAEEARLREAVASNCK